MAPTLPAMTTPPAEHSTSTEPSAAAKRASMSPTALSTKSHKAPPESKKRKTPPSPPPPPEVTPAKTSDATEPAFKKKLVLHAPCHAGGGEQSSKGAAQAKSAGHQSGKDALTHKAKTLDEMRDLYPHLVDEAMALVYPAVLERVLPRIHDNEAQALDKKVKRARRQLTKAIRESPGAPLSSSSSSSAGSKPGLIILSSDDEQEASSWKRSSSLAGSNSKPNVIDLSSSFHDEQEASSWKRSSSDGSKAGPVVLTSSDSDSDGELLANCRKRRLPRNVAWVFYDEVNILTALADERLESGRLPGSPSALLDTIRLRVDLKRENPTAGDVSKKVYSLMDRFKKAIASGGPSGELRDRELYDLSTKVWPELLLPIEHISSPSSSSYGTCSH